MYRVDDNAEIRRLLSRYMFAVNVYQRAVLQWLGRFDAGISPKRRTHIEQRMERAARIYRRLRAEIVAYPHWLETGHELSKHRPSALEVVKGMVRPTAEK